VIERLAAGLARFTVARPWLVLALALATTALAFLGSRRLELDPDVTSLLPRGSEVVDLWRATELEAASSRTLIVAVRGTELAARVPELAESLSASPLVARLDATREDFGVGRVEAAREAPLAYLPESAIAALEERLSDAGLARAAEETKATLAEDPLAGRELATRDPLGLRWILDQVLDETFAAGLEPGTAYVVTRGGAWAFLRVIGREAPFDVEYSKALLADLEWRAERIGGIEATFVGGYALARADEARIRHDLVASSAWSVPLVLLFLVVSTRSLARLHLYFVPAALAGVWALGLAAALLGPMTPLSVSAAAILTGSGVDFAIHYVERYREERRGRTHADAVLAATTHAARPLFGAMTTTVAAYLVFGIGAYQGLRSFGWLLTFGLAFALLAALTVLPVMLRWSGEPRVLSARGWLTRAARAVVGSRWGPGLALALVVAGAAGWGVVARRGLRFDAEPRSMRPQDPDAERVAQAVEEGLGFAPLPVEVLVPASVPLGELAGRVEELRAAGAVAHADGPQAGRFGARRAERLAELRAGLTDLPARAERAFAAAGFQPRAFAAPFEELAALFARDAPPEEPEPFAWRGTEWWHLTLLVPRALDDRAEREGFHAALASALGPEHRAVDPWGLADELGPLLEADLRGAVGWCALLVVALTWLSLGTLAATLAALLPLAIGMGLALGAAAWLGWPLNPGNFVALPLILGLGVDYGIHMLARHREGVDALERTGDVIWRSSIATSIGFGALLSADTPPIASLGLIVLVGVAACTLTSVIVLPPVLRHVQR
jgi:predicted RND superfamily exporter protein